MLLLACALQACSVGSLVFTPEDGQEPLREPSIPPEAPAVGACECSALPVADARIPWSDGWERVAYRPGGGGIALFGAAWNYSQADIEKMARDAPVAPDSPLQTFERGLHLATWDADGSMRRLPCPDLLRGGKTTSEDFGGWSPDGEHYAARFTIETRDRGRRVFDSVVAVCDVASGEWVSNLSLDRCAADLAWDPTSREIALLVRGARWQDLRLRPLAEHASFDPLMLIVSDVEGRELRSAPFLPIPDRFSDPFWLGWSPDGHLLATFTQPTLTERGAELHVFNAHTLVQLDSRRMPDWDCREVSPPQWSRDSRRLAIQLRDGIGLVTLDDAGHLASKTLMAVECQPVQFAWCPDDRQLLVLQQRSVHDFIEFLGTLDFQDCQNSDTLYRAEPLFLDVESGAVDVCGEFVQSKRTDRWHDGWVIPRVGEAFALWTR